jgi:tight adherence protein B
VIGMSFELDPIYVVYLFVAASAGLMVEGLYLLFYSTASYRSNVNRRLQLLTNEPNRENILIQLRRERGLTSAGGYRMGIESVNRLLLQSGLTIGMGKLVVLIAAGAILGAVIDLMVRQDPVEAAVVFVFCGAALPYLVLLFLRNRRRKTFGAQFPDGLDIIVRSLRAGHPVPIAIAMVAREMPDPIGSEFGIVSDEVTFGADLETALRNLYVRIGQDDLPLFVTAVAIQGSTGGNLGEILQNLSAVIRERFKMRRKIRALAAEGRASALILSSLPIVIFLMIQIVAPDFYSGVWNESITKKVLFVAGSWMGVGNLIMYRLVNFRI